jgi:uncharacterized membrane protein
MKLSKINIFKPESFLVFYIGFLALAGAGFVYWKNIGKPTLFGIGFVILSLLTFYLGLTLSKKFKRKKIHPYFVLAFITILAIYYTPILSNFFNITWILSFAICLLAFELLYHFSKQISKWRRLPINFYKALLAVGFAFLVFTFFQIGGLPLFQTALRVNLDKAWAWSGAIFFYLFGYVGLLFHLKKKNQIYFWIIASTALFALTGFRIAILLVLLSGSIVAYKKKALNNKTVLIPLVSALLIVMFIGFFVSGLANPATLLPYRAATTHQVYEQVLSDSIPFGVEQGQFLIGHARPRDYLGEYLGAKNSLTSTFLGPPLMEFGPLFALACMLGLGFILGNAYTSFVKDEPLMKIFYPILLAFSLVWIEIGFDQYMLTFVWVYLVMRWLN